MEAKETRRLRRKSNRQESRTAKEFGGRTTPASGALSGAKGDVKCGKRTSRFNDDDFLIENKFTEDSHYKLELKVWDKIKKEAIREGMRIPLMQIDIRDTQVVLMSSSDVSHLMGGYELVNVTQEVRNRSVRLKEELLLEVFKCNMPAMLTVCFMVGKFNESVSVVKKDLFLEAIGGQHA